MLSFVASAISWLVEVIPLKGVAYGVLEEQTLGPWARHAFFAAGLVAGCALGYLTAFHIHGRCGAGRVGTPTVRRPDVFRTLRVAVDDGSEDEGADRRGSDRRIRLVGAHPGRRRVSGGN